MIVNAHNVTCRLQCVGRRVENEEILIMDNAENKITFTEYNSLGKTQAVCLLAARRRFGAVYESAHGPVRVRCVNPEGSRVISLFRVVSVLVDINFACF
jgi:hypothetical protein